MMQSAQKNQASAVVVPPPAGDGSGVAELAAVVPGELHPQGGAEAVAVNGDADQALLQPEADRLAFGAAGLR